MSLRPQAPPRTRLATAGAGEQHWAAASELCSQIPIFTSLAIVCQSLILHHTASFTETITPPWPPTAHRASTGRVLQTILPSCLRIMSQKASTLQADNRHTEQLDLPAPPASQPELTHGEALYIREALTATSVVNGAGSLVVLGDVPRGATASSGGDVLVFGQCACPLQDTNAALRIYSGNPTPPLLSSEPVRARFDAVSQAAGRGARWRGRQPGGAHRCARAVAAAAEHCWRWCERNLKAVAVCSLGASALRSRAWHLKEALVCSCLQQRTPVITRRCSQPVSPQVGKPSHYAFLFH